LRITERTIQIPRKTNKQNILVSLGEDLRTSLSPKEQIIRFAITESSSDFYNCEVGLSLNENAYSQSSIPSLFDCHVRKYKNETHFNAVLMVPTGIGADIGGDAGDATPVARLLASQCDRLILHPNVVNASDINESVENCLYVEGSVLTRLLLGSIGLQPVRANKLLLVVQQHPDSYFTDAAINSVGAARSTLGLDCEVLIIDYFPEMRASYSPSGVAVGEIDDLSPLLRVLTEYKGRVDAIGLTSLITLQNLQPADYFLSTLVNPWGGVEALLTHAISTYLDIPTAHSPMMENQEIMNQELGVVDPRKAAEAISLTFLHCILKGLYRSPKIITDELMFGRTGVLSASDISCLVIPDGCLGIPTLAALLQGITVVAVRENRNLMKNDLKMLPWLPGQFYQVDNYWEAAGLLAALKAGVSPDSVRRPFPPTSIQNLRTNSHE